MILTPFRYPGAKNKLLPIIKPRLDEFFEWDFYCEPFVGGGSVLLDVAQKKPEAKLFINDKDWWIASFWKVVAEHHSNELPALMKMLEVHPTLDLFYKLKETPANSEVEAAYRAIFFNRTTFSGILKSGPIGGKDQKSQYKIDCRWNARKLGEKIVKCNHLLAGRTQVECKDFKVYFPLTASCYPTYIDPPYYVKGDDLYQEYMTAQDHVDLAKILQGRPNWILSYDDCPEIQELYKNNRIIDLAARYCINGKKDKWVNKCELLILPDSYGNLHKKKP